MRFEAGVATDIGKVRNRNEDSFLVAPPLYAVADGMGGARGGDVASKLALETVEELFHAGKIGLSDQVREANRIVFERSVSDRAVSGMGTTLTAAVLDDEGAHLAHVGDSRAYLLRAGKLRQLTEDHTLVGRMVRAGEISREEAETHPHRNVITRSIGTEPDVKVDLQDVPMLDGDRLLICSDGLTGMVAEGQIQAILESTPAAQEAATRLVRAANNAGGVDNITVVVLDAHDDHADEGGDREARVEGSTDARVADRASAPAGLSGRSTPSARWSIGATGRRKLRRWAIGVAIAIVALVAAAVAVRSFVDRQWYVGEANGHVAVYQGIPAAFAGFDLSHVAAETDILAEEAAALPQYRDLADGITASDRDEATAIVEQIRRDVEAAAGRGS
jgi:protein phosphatase